MPSYKDPTTGKTVTSDEELTDEELEEAFASVQQDNPPNRNPNFNPEVTARNLAHTAGYEKFDPGSIMEGVGSGFEGIGELAKVAGNAGSGNIDPLMQMLGNIPGQSSKNAQHFTDQGDSSRNNILGMLSRIPGLGDTMVSADKGMNEGDLTSAGKAMFDVGMSAAPAGISALKASSGAAKAGLGRAASNLGQKIRPAVSHKLGPIGGGTAEALGTGIGMAAGGKVGHPIMGATVGRNIIGKGGQHVNAARTKIADILDPAGSDAGIFKAARDANQPGPIPPRRIEENWDSTFDDPTPQPASIDDLLREQEVRNSQSSRSYEGFPEEPAPPPPEPINTPRRVEDPSDLQFIDDPGNPGGPRIRREELPPEPLGSIESQMRRNPKVKPSGNPWNEMGGDNFGYESVGDVMGQADNFSNEMTQEDWDILNNPPVPIDKGPLPPSKYQHDINNPPRLKGGLSNLTPEELASLTPEQLRELTEYYR